MDLFAREGRGRAVDRIPAGACGRAENSSFEGHPHQDYEQRDDDGEKETPADAPWFPTFSVCQGQPEFSFNPRHLMNLLGPDVDLFALLAHAAAAGVVGAPAYAATVELEPYANPERQPQPSLQVL